MTIPKDTTTTTVYGPEGTRVVQHSWTTGQAQAELVQTWQADAITDAEQSSTHGRMPRRIYDETTGELVAVLVHPDTYNAGIDAAEGLGRMAETAAVWDETYRPNHNAPHIDPNGNTWLPAIDVVSAYLERQMARYLGVETLDPEVASRMTVWAIELSIAFPLTPDVAGDVPLMSVSDSGEYRWMLAKPIPDTNGLYLREVFGGFWDGWQITAGSGVRLPWTWGNREAATAFARAVHAELPGMDWSRARRDTMTPEIVEKIRAVHLAELERTRPKAAE